MKNLHTAQSRFKLELVLSVLTLVLVAIMCLIFQHHVVKKLTKSTALARPVHHIIVQGKRMTDSEKLAYDREPQPIVTDEPTHKNKAQGD